MTKWQLRLENERLEKENRAWRAACPSLSMGKRFESSYKEKIGALQTTLEKAKETLKFYANLKDNLRTNWHKDNGKEAREALKDISAMQSTDKVGEENTSD